MYYKLSSRDLSKEMQVPEWFNEENTCEHASEAAV